MVRCNAHNLSQQPHTKMIKSYVTLQAPVISIVKIHLKIKKKAKHGPFKIVHMVVIVDSMKCLLLVYLQPWLTSSSGRLTDRVSRPSWWELVLSNIPSTRTSSAGTAHTYAQHFTVFKLAPHENDSHLSLQTLLSAFPLFSPYLRTFSANWPMF